MHGYRTGVCVTGCIEIEVLDERSERSGLEASGLFVKKYLQHNEIQERPVSVQTVE